MINWVKAPSVAPGGKPFFYTARVGNQRFWVVWNRRARKWEVTKETLGGQSHIEYVNSIAAGKSLVARITKK